MELNINNLIKYLFITLAISLISITSSAGVKTVFITTDKNEISESINQNVSSQKKKEQYLNNIRSSQVLNQYKFKAEKNSPNEIEFIQTAANMTIFQLIGDDLKTVNNSSGKEISKLVFKRQDDKNIVVDVERVSFENPSEPNRLYYQIQATFVEGTWADLIENRPVVIAVSNQEESKSKPYIQDWMKRKIFNEAVKKAGNMIKGVFAKSKLEFKAPQIKGNLDQMVHTVNKTKAEFEIQWSLF